MRWQPAERCAGPLMCICVHPPPKLEVAAQDRLARHTKSSNFLGAFTRGVRGCCLSHHSPLETKERRRCASETAPAAKVTNTTVGIHIMW